eukprot:TRINITY_DN56438_c0_g1_i1.p1 TRINITY_DN56438_c0_g1~~TRINITY_DN56438_c0_g1_i1.p1  ORF type:complete len:549 (+),score=179.98 TRINITY_DN56438_c0_g1_i1:76-1647(+)
MAAAAVAAVLAAHAVWPPPRSISVSGGPLPLAPSFTVSAAFDRLGAAPAAEAAARLSAAAARYNAIVSAVSPPAARAAENGVASLAVAVANDSTALGGSTRYDYNLSVSGGAATAAAATVYGAVYAMETFAQLIGSDGQLRYSSVGIADSPQYAWRGLMIDSGRRFFPVPLVKNLMDTMTANKLNVLHLHASDHCRFGVESKIFPNLTASLTGERAGHYSQSDIADLISYAADRGIRVVPEFDVPGHSRGFIPLESEGIKFCTDSASRSQLYGDPANSTYSVLAKLFAEMSSLFPDEVFNIGCDETAAKGPCSVDSTFALERKLLNYIATDLKKTPAGWEEVLFDADAATQDTIVDAWTRHTPAEIIAKGRRAINSKSSHFYFTRPAPGGPSGWSPCWYDIATGLATADKNKLLGGEMSMWSDTYCNTAQCGASGGSAPVGHELFDPKHDAEFSRSIGGMIWPRGFVAAASFWNFNATADPTSAQFTDAIWRLNDQLMQRGAYSCPTNCSCDQLSACGKPYLS